MKIEEYILAWIFLSLISSGFTVAIVTNIANGIKDWRKLEFKKKFARYWVVKDFHS